LFVPVHNDDMLPDLVKFGDGLEFDRTAYELRRLGRAVKLERIPMEILLLMMDRRGELISRGEIIEKIWGNDVFFDTDNSINSAIRKIRQVLKDDPENPAYIQTVTGKGYRFIAEIVAPETPPIVSIAAIGEAQPIDAVSAIEPTVSASLMKRRWIAGLTALIALIAIVSPIVWLRSRRVATPHRVMLAVLPFANLSDDREQEYFSDGITDVKIFVFG
jgi:DNA-binding winged helix-turn-helix (wHTH) protein